MKQYLAEERKIYIYIYITIIINVVYFPFLVRQLPLEQYVVRCGQKRVQRAVCYDSKRFTRYSFEYKTKFDFVRIQKNFFTQFVRGFILTYSLDYRVRQVQTPSVESKTKFNNRNRTRRSKNLSEINNDWLDSSVHELEPTTKIIYWRVCKVSRRSS